MASTIFLLGITFCTLTTAASLSSGVGNSDVVSMIQMGMASRKEKQAMIDGVSPDDPLWVHMKAEPATKFFDDVPVFKYHRVRMGIMSARNQWIVVYPENYTEQMLHEGCAKLKSPAMCDHVSHPEKGELAFTTVHAFENELRASEMYKIFTPKAKYIQVDGTMHMFQVPWGLDRIDQMSNHLDGKYTVVQGGNFGRTAVHIYHLDTGVNSELEEFAVGRSIRHWDITTPHSSCPKPASKWCSERQAGPCASSCATDNQGHGTHTAGTICSTNYGVANGAICHSMKVLNDKGSGAWSWFIEALNEVASGGWKPSVVSASLGGPGLEPAVEESINKATQKNVVVVVAAGNESKDACKSTPGFVKTAVVVGSTDPSDQVSSFSNYGSCIDIMAPGNGIPSVNNLGYRTVLSGTSMSAPHVAGGVALLLNPLSPATSDNMKTKLASGGIKLSSTGYKLLHVAPVR